MAGQQGEINSSGAVAGRDVNLSGTTTAGRDVIIHQQTVQVSSAPSVMPSELPAPVAGFVDRDEHVERLTALLRSGATRNAVRVVTVHGPAGIGKTALTLEVAHRARAGFPGGQLFMNLAGIGSAPLAPEAVLGEFLRALGVASPPDGLEDRARIYRSVLARDAHLVVLDNAHDEQQLVPLLPGSAGCAVLVTSRRALNLTQGTDRVALDVLDREHSLRLLGDLAGTARISGQRAEAERIVASCGGLPLALRIAGARLSSRPHWPLLRLAQRLSDERRRLGELNMGNDEVRAGFALSYDGLPAAAQRLFLLLGQVPTLDFPAWLPAVLLDVPPPAAEDLADDLVEGHLLQAGEASEEREVRYRFHDLLRSFAIERLGEEPLTGVAEQVWAAYLYLAVRADSGFSAANSAYLGPPPTTPAASLAAHLDTFVGSPSGWFNIERANLMRIMGQAHEAGQWRWVWQLASAMWQYLEVTGRWSDWEFAFGLALDAGRRAGDRYAEGLALRLLGRLELSRGRVSRADELLGEALRVQLEIGDVFGECMTRKDRSVVERLRNRHAAATELLLAALDGFRRQDQPYWAAIVRRELGIEYRYQGAYPDAEAHFIAAAASFDAAGEPLQEAQTLFELGVLYRLRGDGASAWRCFDRARPTFERLNARGAAVWMRREEGLLLAGEGDLDAAAEVLTECLPRWSDLDDERQFAATEHELALIRRTQGRGAEAAELASASQRTFERLQDEVSAARSGVTWATSLLELGSPEYAIVLVDAALPAFRANGDLLWEVKAQRVLADGYAAMGDAAAAAQARTLAEGLGRYLGGTADETRV